MNRDVAAGYGLTQIDLLHGVLTWKPDRRAPRDVIWQFFRPRDVKLVLPAAMKK